jgi:hypothetical protein
MSAVINHVNPQLRNKKIQLKGKKNRVTSENYQLFSEKTKIK